MPLSKLVPGDKALAADSVVRSKIVTTLEEMSNMTLQEFLHTIITGALEVAGKIIIAIALYFIGRWVIKRVTKLLQRAFIRRDVDVSLRTFLLSLVQISLTIILITIAVSILGINTTGFVALFASAGLAVGMALSGTLQNFAGGVMVLILKPYRVGDFIEAQGQTGTVKEIRLFNTLINTVDNKTIIIPNGGISTGIINNYSKEELRRVDWKFGIAYGDDYRKARDIIAELLDKDVRVLKEPAYFIALNSLADSAVIIVVRAWTATEDYWDVYFDMNEKIYKAFPEHGINFPYPQMDVHLKKKD